MPSRAHDDVAANDERGASGPIPRREPSSGLSDREHTHRTFFRSEDHHRDARDAGRIRGVVRSHAAADDGIRYRHERPRAQVSGHQDAEFQLGRTMRNLPDRARASVRRAAAPGGGTAKLDVAEASRCDRNGELASPGEIAEAATLLSRLVYYSRMDPVMCRPAWHL